MRTHPLVVKCREIRSTSPRVVANQIKADYIELSLDSEWDGMSVAVIFGCGESAVKLLWEGEPLPIPSELTKEPGYIPVTVAGYLDDVRVVSAEARDALAVVPSGCYDGSDPIPDEPDMLGQLTQAAKDATDAAGAATEAAQTAADAAKAATDSAASADAAAKMADVAAERADESAKGADEAAEDARNAAQAAGEKSLYAYADPENDALIILEYPAFLESEDGGSVYLTIEGSDN